ncbi:hypothetical protein Tco_0352492 [Tanacetum coccineum]
MLDILPLDIGEELIPEYEGFRHIISMLELHEATVSIEDANLKFLRSLPSVWHVVATMIRGQPGLEKVKGSTLKQSTAEPANILKGYTQAISSKVPTAPNCASYSDEIICSFFAQQSILCPQLMMMKTCCKLMKMPWKKLTFDGKVAMITARIRKFMRKTGRSIDLKPKNGITFDKKSRNGRNEKRLVANEDSNSKALVATDNNEDIDWTKEFDDEPVTYAMMALTGVEQDDWSIEFDAGAHALWIKMT